MFGSKRDKDRDKEKKRFYLLPGMGGRAYRRKQAVILKASLIVGAIVAGLLGLALYFIASSPK